MQRKSSYSSAQNNGIILVILFVFVIFCVHLRLCLQIQMAHAWISIPDFKNHPRTAVAVWGGVDFIYNSLFCSFRAFYCNRRRAYLNIFYIFPICFQILTFFILLLMFVLLCPDVKIISCGGQYHNTRVFPKKVFVILLNVH